MRSIHPGLPEHPCLGRREEAGNVVHRRPGHRGRKYSSCHEGHVRSRGAARDGAGSYMDYTMVFIGEEGDRQEQAARPDLPDTRWFVDSCPITGKEYENIRGKWIVEIAELVGLRKSGRRGERTSCRSGPTSTGRPTTVIRRTSQDSVFSLVRATILIFFKGSAGIPSGPVKSTRKEK